MGFNHELHVRSISHQPFVRFSLNITQMLLIMSFCADYIDSRSRSQFKIMSFTHWIWCLLHISWTFKPFSINFTQMLISVRQWAEPIARLCRLKVEVTVKGHGIYPWISCLLIAPEPFEWFSLSFTQNFLSLTKTLRSNLVEIWSASGNWQGFFFIYANRNTDINGVDSKLSVFEQVHEIKIACHAKSHIPCLWMGMHKVVLWKLY